MAVSSKEKILQAACNLFYHNGYLATSVDDIIAQAEVSKSNFYYHFKSKEDLGIAVLEQRKEDFQMTLAGTLCHPALAPKERLRRFLGVLMEWQETSAQRGGCPFGNLVAEMSEHSERFRCQLSTMFGGLTARIAEVVAEGQQQGVFRRDVKAGDLAALIVQMTQGMQLMTKCHKTGAHFEPSVRTLLRLIETSG